MRLPRNFKMFRGGLDASAVAGTMFLLWMVTLLHSSLVLPPGVRLNLPDAPGLVGEVVPRNAAGLPRFRACTRRRAAAQLQCALRGRLGPHVRG